MNILHTNIVEKILQYFIRKIKIMVQFTFIIYRLLGRTTSSIFKFLKCSNNSSEFLFDIVGAEKSIPNHLNKSDILPSLALKTFDGCLDRLKADSKDIVETGTLRTSRPNLERIGKSFSCYFHHCKISISSDNKIILVFRYVSNIRNMS